MSNHALMCVSEKCKSMYPAFGGSLHATNEVIYNTIAHSISAFSDFTGQYIMKNVKPPLSFTGKRDQIAAAAANAQNYPCPNCGSPKHWRDAETYLQSLGYPPNEVKTLLDRLPK